jgi:hypothetical protein
MNDQTGKTPRTDEAERAYVNYTSNPPDGIWTELKKGKDDDIAQSFLKNAPPNGWKTARQLELGNQELKLLLDNAINDRDINWQKLIHCRKELSQLQSAGEELAKLREGCLRASGASQTTINADNILTNWNNLTKKEK